MKTEQIKQDGIPMSKPIPFFRQYNIFEDGTVVNSDTGKVIKPRGLGLSVNLVTDRGTYTTRTVRGLLIDTWIKK